MKSTFAASKYTLDLDLLRKLVIPGLLKRQQMPISKCQISLIICWILACKHFDYCKQNMNVVNSSKDVLKK